MVYVVISYIMSDKSDLVPLNKKLAQFHRQGEGKIPR